MKKGQTQAALDEGNVVELFEEEDEGDFSDLIDAIENCFEGRTRGIDERVLRDFPGATVTITIGDEGYCVECADTEE